VTGRFHFSSHLRRSANPERVVNGGYRYAGIHAGSVWPAWKTDYKLRSSCMSQYWINFAFRIGVETFHLGTFRDVGFGAAVTPVSGKRLKQCFLILERAVKLDPGIDQAGDERQAFLVETTFVKKIKDVAAVFQAGHVLDRDNDAVGCIQGVLGSECPARAWYRL